MSGYTETDYEAIEAAVLESPRGRWFLGEFTRRNRAADTSMLLEAIRKLERGVAEHAPDRISDDLAADLHSLSDVIGTALAGISDAPEDPAELIEHLRATFDRLLQVKRQIDTMVAGRSSVPAAGDARLTADHLEFFKGDEDLFEAAPAKGSETTPSLAVVGGEEGRTRPAPQAMKADPGAAPPPSREPTDRIVFIRRASSRETSIPLADEPENEAVSARSQPAS